MRQKRIEVSEINIVFFKWKNKYYRLNKWNNICFTNCYKTYKNLKFTILKFSNACKPN